MNPAGSKLSPEERLLALIRGKGKASPQAASTQQSESAPAVVMVAPSAKKTIQSLRWTQWMMAGLGVILLLEAGFIAMQLAKPLPVVMVPELPPATRPTQTTPQPLQDVPSLAASATRPLFGSSSQQAVSPENGQAQQQRLGPSELAKQLVARLTLTGIVAGETPQAVIEDNETKKTYFVTIGQAVAEGAVLEQVLDNRVILDLSGEKISLSL